MAILKATTCDQTMMAFQMRPVLPKNHWSAGVNRGPNPARDLHRQKFTDAETRAVRGAPWNR